MNSEQASYSPNTERKFICPWQIAHFIDNSLRPLIHNPRKLFGPYVREGMVVLDVGCGGGFASLGLAKLVGEGGCVISADIQPEMLDIVRKRAIKAGLANRIRIHRCEYDRIGVYEELDFVVAFFMLHEVPDSRAFLEQLYALLKADGRLFLSEPKLHVSRRDFEQMVKEAQSIGFSVLERPIVKIGMTVVLVKSNPYLFYNTDRSVF